ncbi:MAG: hypothetical protein ACERKO_11270, partial [Acetanaerobacterium sp.]
MPKQLVARIAVDKVALHFDKEYSYAVPDAMLTAVSGAISGEMRCAVCVGARVLVPFGGANRRRQGLVLSLCEEEHNGALKPVAELVDEVPLLSGDMLALVRFLKRHTLCTWYEAARLVLPAGLNMEISTVYSIAPSFSKGGGELADDEMRRIASCLLSHRKPVSEKVLLAGAGIGRRSSALRAMIADGVVIKGENAVRKTKDERILMARLVPDADTPAATPKQRAVTELLTFCASASVKEIKYY